MLITSLAMVVLGLVGSESGGAAAASEEEAVEHVLRAYNDALERGQPDKVLQVLGSSYFMADEQTPSGSARLTAHLYLTGEALQSWPANYLREVGPHRNEFRVVSFSMRRDAAILLTRDTGSNKFRRWKDEEVAWFFGRTAGAWRIVGMVIRDIQLPKQQ